MRVGAASGQDGEVQAVSRRSVLAAALGGCGAVALGCDAAPAASSRPRAIRDPFTLGVASGEPVSDGMVLWTRLAPDPVAEDGTGGMPSAGYPVDWELAADERFTQVAQRGRVDAVADSAHSVHVEVHGLAPGRDWWFRFRQGRHLSPAGRTRTAPDRRAVEPLLLCTASCARWDHGRFTAYRHLAGEHPDLVLHLGDYIYERPAGDPAPTAGMVREVAGAEARSLAGYRQRYAQYRTDPALQAAHAAAPWAVVYDDHEVVNDWDAGSSPTRRADAMQAWFENMPVRAAARPRGARIQLYRRLQWGALATLHLLDTRQFRSAPSITGPAQERWLADGLRGSGTTWDLLGSQVMFARLDLDAGAGEELHPQRWDGFDSSRNRVRTMLRDHVDSAVVLSGDAHLHVAAEVRERPDGPAVATELVTTSIASGGDGSDTVDGLVAENPHVGFLGNRRGYLRTRITPELLRADFRAVDYVSREGAPIRTQASCTIDPGRPGLQF